MQTLDNGIEVPTNGDDYQLTADLTNMGATANVVTRPANKTAQNALSKYQGRATYRLDAGRLEFWNGSRWSVSADTQIGHAYTTPSTIAGVAYATVATVSVNSLGGDLMLSYNGVVENANSGANRTADVQFLVDGAAFAGTTFNAPLVAGFDNPATSVSDTRKYSASAGNHTIELQTRANAAGAVRNVKFSLTVKELP